MNRDPVPNFSTQFVRNLRSSLGLLLLSVASISAQTTTQDTSVEFTTYEAWKWVQPDYSTTTGPRMNVRADREVEQTGPTSASLMKATNQLVLVDGQVTGGVGTGFDDDKDGYSNEQEWAAEELYGLWGGWYAAWPGDVPPPPDVPLYANMDRGILEQLYGDAVDIDRDGYSDTLEIAAARAQLLPDTYYYWWGNRNPGGERDVVWTTLADGRSWPFSITNVTPAKYVRPYSGGYVRIIGAPSGCTIQRPQSLIDYSTQYYAKNPTTGSVDINNMSVYHWGKKYPTATAAKSAETDMLPGAYTVDYRSILNPYQQAGANVQLYPIPNGSLTLGQKQPSWLLRSVATIGKLSEPPTLQKWVDGRIEFDPDLNNTLTWDNLAKLSLANAVTDTLTLTVYDTAGVRLWPNPTDYPATESINLSLLDPKLEVIFGKLYGIPGKNGLATSILRKDANLVFRYKRVWKMPTTGDWSTVTLSVPVRFVQSYESWRKTMFFGANLTNDGVSGPTADYDQDGYTNIEEYNNGTNPLVQEYKFKLQTDAAKALTPTTVTLAATMYNDTKIMPVTVLEWGFVYAKQEENPIPAIGGAFTYSIPKASSLTSDKTTFAPNAITYLNTKGETVKPPYPASLVGAFDLDIANNSTVVTTDPVSATPASYLTPLDPNTTYAYRAYAQTDTDGLVYSEDVMTFTTPPASLPTVKDPFGVITLEGTVLTLTGGGTSTSDGGSAITEQGIVYSDITKNDIPTIGGNDTTKKPGSPATTVGRFSIALPANTSNNLVAGKTYAYRAYATNEVGTAYSAIVGTFTVPLPLDVTTLLPANVVVGSTFASTGGDVISDGAAVIVDRGVVYSTTSTAPSVQLPTVVPTPTTGTIRASQNMTGPFTVFISNLSPGTTYNYRAFVRSSLNGSYKYGTSYQFRTISTIPSVSAPTLLTNATTGLTATWRCATIRENGSAITERGMVYALSSDPVPAIGSSGVTQRPAATQTGTALFDINAIGLIPGSEYRVRAYAKNSVGYAYSDSLLFRTLAAPMFGDLSHSQVMGDSAVLSSSILYPTLANLTDIKKRGFVYSLVSENPNPLLSDVGSTAYDKPATFISIEQFSSSVTGLLPNSDYCYKAYAENATGLSYSSVIGYFTTRRLPTVANPIITSIAALSANAKSNILSSGDSPVTEAGFVFALTSTTANPVIGGTDTFQVPTTVANAEFTDLLSGLSQESIYSVRAYAINSEGTGYSGSVAFTSVKLPELTSPTVDNIQASSVILGATLVNANTSPVIRSGVLVVPQSITLLPKIDTPGVIRVESAVPAVGPNTLFTEQVSGLLPGITYSFCGFTETSAGVGYSPVSLFRTANFAEVSSPSIADITTTSVLLGMNLISNGGEAVTEIGIAYSLTSMNSNPVPGGPGVTTVKAFAMPSVGPTYFARLSNLTASTEYTVRAYAINSAGNAYSPAWSFTTEVTNFPTVASFFTTSTYDTETETSTIGLGGNVITDGGSTITARGVVYATSDSNTVPALGAVGVTAVAATTSALGHFNVNVTGLEPGVTYVFRAYASNAEGTGYSPTLRFTSASPPVAAAIATALTNGSAQVQWVSASSASGQIKSMSLTSSPKIPQFFYQIQESQSGMLGNCVIEVSEDAISWTELSEQNWQVDYAATYLRAVWKINSGAPPERAFFRVKVSSTNP